MASTMIQDIFGNTLPGIVDAGFAGTYVVMISVFNMLGRFFWSSCSDYLGRKTTLLDLLCPGDIPVRFDSLLCPCGER